MRRGFTPAPLLKKSGAGFTLVELLVAISIIAILSAVGLAIFSNIQSKARDSIRKNDLRSLATALEIYFQKKGQYIGTPQGDGSCTVNSGQFYNEITPQINGPVPKDPETKQEYLYAAENKCQSYRLFAKLENCTDSILCSYENYNYSLTSPDLKVAPAQGDAISKPSPCPPYGDVNGDGSITNADAEMIFQADSGGPALTDEQNRRANVDGTGTVADVSDGQLIVLYLANRKNTFPVCGP